MEARIANTAIVYKNPTATVDSSKKLSDDIAIFFSKIEFSPELTGKFPGFFKDPSKK